MSEKVTTVKIKTENGPVLINMSDFDSKKHQLFEEGKKTVEEFDRKAAVQYLKDKNVKFKGNISNDDLKTLVEETKKGE